MLTSTIGNWNNSINRSPRKVPSWFGLHCAQGFTLLELTVVLVLISIATAFAMPKLSSLVVSGTALQQSARKLSRFFLQSSRYAAQSSQSFRVIYTTATNRVQLVPQDTVKDVADNELPSCQLEHSVIIRDFQSYYRGVLPLESRYLSLSAQGYLEPAYVHLQDDDGDAMTLQLLPFLHEINIYSGYQDLDRESFH